MAYAMTCWWVLIRRYDCGAGAARGEAEGGGGGRHVARVHRGSCGQTRPNEHPGPEFQSWPLIQERVPKVPGTAGWFRTKLEPG